MKPHTIATAKYFGVTVYHLKGEYNTLFTGREMVEKYGGHFTIFPKGNDIFRLEHWHG